jgi:hypothetical protein
MRLQNLLRRLLTRMRTHPAPSAPLDSAARWKAAGVKRETGSRGRTILLGPDVFSGRISESERPRSADHDPSNQ